MWPSGDFGYLLNISDEDFHKQMAEAYGEWSIDIERYRYHLGQDNVDIILAYLG